MTQPLFPSLVKESRPLRVGGEGPPRAGSDRSEKGQRWRTRWLLLSPLIGTDRLGLEAQLCLFLAGDPEQVTDPSDPQFLHL